MERYVSSQIQRQLRDFLACLILFSYEGSLVSLLPHSSGALVWSAGFLLPREESEKRGWSSNRGEAAYTKIRYLLYSPRFY